jgi:pSer/pThr/pTyr-binding forkhead associated (FHA) protein
VADVQSKASTSLAETAPLPAAPAAGAAPRAALTVRGGDGSGQVYPLDGRLITLGRGSDADIRLADTGISRRHVQLRWDGNSYVLEDLRSSNGSFVNGDLVHATSLRPGDIVKVGNTSLEFSLL